MKDPRFNIPLNQLQGPPKSQYDDDSSFKHSASRTDFKIQNPRLADNQSIGPVSGKDSSTFTRFDSEYHETLLKWDFHIPVERAERVIDTLVV